MDAEKRKRLEAKGWKLGGYADFLGMTEAERAGQERWRELQRRADECLKAGAISPEEDARRDDLLNQRQVRGMARAFAKGGKALEDLRAIPGFDETGERRRSMIQSAMLEARRRARLSQAEIARRMGVAQPNVARIERSGRMTTDTFAAYLEACGARLALA
jgi:ribosome-binding protein aMBF1 (putative translation factor)